MKRTAMFLSILLLLLLVACQDEASETAAVPEATAVPEPTAAAQDTRAEEVSTEPTEEPEAPEPTAEPTEEPVAETEEVDLTALMDTPWQWISFTNPMEQFEVEMPENYSVTFNEDGTLNVMADCNNASGSYTVGDSSLTIAMGPNTMAACPEGSRSDQFVQLMTGAAIYFFEDDSLFIDLMADGGTMAFRPAMMAEQIPSEAEGAASGTLPEDIVGQLDAFLQSQVYTEGGNPELAAPGLVLLVDAPDGRYLKAAGVADMDDGTPIQVDDILQIGSNTKSMVIILLMQLVE